MAPPPSVAQAAPAEQVPTKPTADAVLLHANKSTSSSTLQPDAKPMPIPRPPTYSSPLLARHRLKQHLACAFRIFAHHNLSEGVAGHITLRDPVLPDHFWVNPFGLDFSLIRASDLLLLNHQGQVVDGPKERRMVNTAAFQIHAAVHHARPDVVCAAHAHGLHGRTFSAFSRKLRMLTQDSCAFYDDHVVVPGFEGIVLGSAEAERIASTLGPHKAAILANHGLLTVGQTIEEAVFWFLSMEKCCASQLLAEAAEAGGRGLAIEIGDAEAEFTRRVVGSSVGGWFSARAEFEKFERREGAEFCDEEFKEEEQ